MLEKIDNRELINRAIYLFAYLREMVKLGIRPVYHHRNYDKLIWLADLKNDTHLTNQLLSNTNSANGQWIEVRGSQKNPPKPPQILEKWLVKTQLTDPETDFPQLHQRIASTLGHDVENVVVEQLSDVRSEILPLYEEYMDKQWLPWQQRVNAAKNADKIFSNIYSMYQRQEKFGEVYEVNLGIGCLNFSNEKETIQRHLITCNASIAYDPEANILRVYPSVEELNATVEYDFLDKLMPSAANHIKDLQIEVTKLGSAILDKSVFGNLMAKWQKSLPTDMVYSDQLRPMTDYENVIQTSFAPALFLRKRNDRSLVEMYNKIIHDIQVKKRIPKRVEALVSVMEKDSSETFFDYDQLHFGLPANEEQEAIAEVLKQNDGVVVEGPPGTGKSHTITNLIMHYLANGKRVLVTAYAARALRVLEKMLPKELHGLCVIATGDDENATVSIEKNIQSVMNSLRGFDSVQTEKMITRIEEKLSQSIENESKIINAFTKYAKKESVRHNTGIADYNGTLSEIALRIYREKTKYDWITDQLDHDVELDLTANDVVAYLDVQRFFTPAQEKTIRKELIDPEELPTPEEFEIATEKFAAIQTRLDNMKVNLRHMGPDASREKYKRISKENRLELLNNIEKVINTIDILDNHSYHWVRKAIIETLDGNFSVWQTLNDKSVEIINRISEQLEMVGDISVSGLNGKDLLHIKDCAVTLSNYLLSNSANIQIGLFQPREIKDANNELKRVLVNGQACNSLYNIDLLIDYIDVKDGLNRLAKLWDIYIETPTKATMPIQIAEYKNYVKTLEKLLNLKSDVAELKNVLAKIPEISQQTATKIERIRELHTVLRATDVLSEFKVINTEFTHWKNIIIVAQRNQNVHHVLAEVFDAIANRNTESYENAYSTFQSVWQLNLTLKASDSTRKKLMKYLPSFIKMIQVDPFEETLDAKAQDIEAAISWNRTQSWINQIQTSENEQQMLKDLNSNRRNVEKLRKKLVELLAWKRCIENMTESERQSLEAWQNAMKRFGKGTGKYALKEAKLAKQHLRNCRTAIPAWIMPLYRVAQMVEPGKEEFDVVIIDEASQSGSEALFLNYIAKQVIVVGDDKQISSESIGVNRDIVHRMNEKYLSNIPHSDIYNLDNSFFDQAKVRFGNIIRLREHFRSMPEIIGFSNELSYHNEPLMPLRQFGSSRLSPTMVRRFVSNGEVSRGNGGFVNENELEMLVLEIERCCQNPLYKGKTFGVISLLGSAQAKLIEQRLLEKLGASEIEQRQLVCGDAYAFQGDERDVVFLSMVIAPNKRFATLTSEKDTRRFNVAFSRAKDQCFVFHSVQAEQLNEDCLRYKVLNYKPIKHAHSYSLSDIDIASLWDQAKNSSRNRVTPPEPFDSWYQLDVFLKLIQQGANVIPSVEIDRYKIDLVVEGKVSRIAVVLIGEEWIGEEEFAKDMQRRQRLEACGWKFVSVFASQFYSEPEQALELVWKTLAENEPVSGNFDNNKNLRLKTNKFIYAEVNAN